MGHTYFLWGFLKKNIGVTHFYVLFFSVIMMSITVFAYAQEEKDRPGGLFSEGSFLSEALSSAADKLNKVGSGEERIVDNDAKGAPDDIMEYDMDSFRRPGSSFTREDYRRNSERPEEMKKNRDENPH